MGFRSAPNPIWYGALSDDSPQHKTSLSSRRRLSILPSIAPLQVAFCQSYPLGFWYLFSLSNFAVSLRPDEAGADLIASDIIVQFQPSKGGAVLQPNSRRHHHRKQYVRVPDTATPCLPGPTLPTSVQARPCYLPTSLRRLPRPSSTTKPLAWAVRNSNDTLPTVICVILTFSFSGHSRRAFSPFGTSNRYRQPSQVRPSRLS